MAGHDETERFCVECGEPGATDTAGRCVYCEFGAYWAAHESQRDLVAEAGLCVKCGAEAGAGRLCGECADEALVADYALTRTTRGTRWSAPETTSARCDRCGDMLPTDETECGCVVAAA